MGFAKIVVYTHDDFERYLSFCRFEIDLDHKIIKNIMIQVYLWLTWIIILSMILLISCREVNE